MDIVDKLISELTREELECSYKTQLAINGVLQRALDNEIEQAQLYKKKNEALEKASKKDFLVFRDLHNEIDRLKMTIEIMEGDIEHLESQLEAINK